MRITNLLLCCCIVAFAAQSSVGDYRITAEHPRIFITKPGLPALARRCAASLKDDYDMLKRQADEAVARGSIRFLNNKWAVPDDLMACALVYLVERQSGAQADPYAELIIRTWGDGRMLLNRDNCAFGYHAIAYDWIFDAMSPAQRKTFGDALGSWLTWYTGRAEITLRNGSWDYNQTWGPSHLNVPQSRDAITQKLLISLAINGAGTVHEDASRMFLGSWARRVPAECIPAFDDMGGSWSESHGHGGYGPIQVVPYAFAAWQSATGQNLFAAGKPWSYLREMSRWLALLRVPHSGRLAYIDDGGGELDAGFAASAPFVSRALGDSLAEWFATLQVERDRQRYVWQRVAASSDRPVRASSPAEIKLPLGYLLRGAGHVFMRSDWDDPNATWAFFGAGPHRVGHQHDDEGHFLISKRGGLISKGGGKGTNDEDHYWGGSLVFNILTIFDPSETFRRNRNNENDGGMIRYVYDNSHRERGSIVAFAHRPQFTYAAADLTKAYNSSKAKEVTRQFLYLRSASGKDGDEFFVVFDRVHSTRADFAKHFMLHMPEEPQVSGETTEVVPGHVAEYRGDNLSATWLSLPEDFGPRVEVLSQGRSRMHMQTLLPQRATLVKRGGEGHRNWGHPLEPTAQYDHDTPGRSQPPVSNWRLEVAAPLSERTCFLHVFQVTEENKLQMASAVITQKDGKVQLEINNREYPWKILLSEEGPLSLSILPPGQTPVTIPTAVDLSSQPLNP